MAEFYQSDLTRDGGSFMLEYRSWIRQFLDKPGSERPHTAMDALRSCKEQFEPNVFRLLKVCFAFYNISLP